MRRPRPRWYVIQRLKRLEYDPLAPLVYAGLLGILAFCVFVYNLLTHPW